MTSLNISLEDQRYGCVILHRVISTGFARLTTFRVARERVKFDSISATGFCKGSWIDSTP
ncbi:hypothetical protein PVAP13_3KG362227 [Panicum virgatum]|uniref:Uncharacterized protein n=1 Tax=Panicum virgatum TaxID=38727 RepID=A0A8T0UKS1_PANVG|nr:hypothetical protein PVAP13_3KG362227 [Panicum virgatum]